MGRYAHRDHEGRLIKLTAMPNGSSELLGEDDPESIAYMDDSRTINDIYDTTIQNHKLLKAVVLLLNDGSFVPGADLTGQDLKDLILTKMNGG